MREREREIMKKKNREKQILFYNEGEEWTIEDIENKRERDRERVNYVKGDRGQITRIFFCVLLFPVEEFLEWHVSICIKKKLKIQQHDVIVVSTNEPDGWWRSEERKAQL